MRIAHVEPLGGAAGNMLLGALVDAGADASELEARLRTIVARGWTLEQTRVTRRGIAGLHLEISIDADAEAAGAHGVRLADVLAIVERSGLSRSQQARAGEVYRALARAEARVHGTSVDAIHFHEVGALDAILDVAGFFVACDLLGVERVTCGPLPIGTGEIAMAHGRYPNPPPATAELLRGLPIYDAQVAGELVTPTAAAILRTVCVGFGPRPAMTVESWGYGAGTRDGEIPNLTRIGIGVPAARDASEVSVLEANVDDMSPQFFELALERLFAAGALDVWLSPITMKKGRPAIVLAAIAPLEREAACAHAMIRETSTIGVRVRTERRYVMDRSTRTVDTAFGPIRVKDVRMNGTARSTPEYDDVVRIARERGEPVLPIYRAALAALENA